MSLSFGAIPSIFRSSAEDDQVWTSHGQRTIPEEQLTIPDTNALDWKGLWAGGTTYAVDDWVEYLGAAYRCIAISTGDTPPNAGFWELVSSDTNTQYTAMEVVVAADGSGDYTTIAAGMAALAANPGVLWVKAGTYTITAAINLQTTQELRGSGYGTLIQATTNIGLVTATGANTGVYNVRLKGNSAGASQSGVGISAANCTVRDSYIDDMGANGVVAVGASGTIVDGCKITNCSGNGIYFFAAHLGAVTNTDITTCDDNAIDIASSFYNVVVGCQIHNNGSADAQDSGIFLDGNCFQNVIQGNSIRDQAGVRETGVYIYDNGGGDVPVDTLISGNIMENNTVNFVDEGTDTQIGHNIGTT